MKIVLFLVAYAFLSTLVLLFIKGCDDQDDDFSGGERNTRCPNSDIGTLTKEQDNEHSTSSSHRPRD